MCIGLCIVFSRCFALWEVSDCREDFGGFTLVCSGLAPRFFFFFSFFFSFLCYANVKKKKKKENLYVVITRFLQGRIQVIVQFVISYGSVFSGSSSQEGRGRCPGHQHVCASVSSLMFRYGLRSLSELSSRRNSWSSFIIKIQIPNILF